MLSIGTKAPDFTGTTDLGETFRLAEWLGKGHVVLYFYVRDFGWGWSLEARSFRDHYEAVTGLGAVLVGVSTDTAERHRQFRALNGLPFPLIADPARQITKLYDVRRRFGLGTSRVTYVVDREGVIQGVFHNELDMADHVRGALATLRRLQA